MMGNSSKGLGLGAKLLATSVVLGAVGVLAGFGTWSAFSSTTSNEANKFEAGTVALSDNDGGGVMFNLTGLKPGEPGASGAKCIEVSYTGSLDAAVKLSGSTTSGSLGTYLNLKVTRGTISSPTFAGCTGFSPDATEYISGKGNGVVYDGTLANFPTSSGTPIQYPASNWAKDTKAVYKFEASVQDTASAQGQNATGVKFTWEATSS